MTRPGLRRLRLPATVLAVALATAGVILGSAGEREPDRGAEFAVMYKLDDGTPRTESVWLPRITCTATGGTLEYRATGAGPAEASGTVTLDPPGGVIVITLPDGRRFRAEQVYDANEDGFAFIAVFGPLLGPGTDPDGPVLSPKVRAVGSLTC